MILHDAHGQVRRLLRDLARGWAVLVSTEELAREGTVPDVVQVVASVRPRPVLVVAMPTDEVLRAYPALGPAGELAAMAAELRGVAPSGAHPLVVVLGGSLLVAWAWPDASLQLLGLGRV